MYVSCPLALSCLLVVLVYSHLSIPSSVQAVTHLFIARRPQLNYDRPIVEEKAISILNSELASPLVSLLLLTGKLLMVNR